MLSFVTGRLAAATAATVESRSFVTSRLAAAAVVEAHSFATNRLAAGAAEKSSSTTLKSL